MPSQAPVTGNLRLLEVTGTRTLDPFAPQRA
jgi:hypothetical protein